MTASDYLLPEGMTLADARRALAELLDVRDGRSAVTTRLFLDTFDGRIHEAGLLASWEEGQLTLTQRTSDRLVARAPLAKPSRRVFAADVPGGGLRSALGPLLEERALLPVVEIRNRERLLDVLDSERKTVVRMRLQQPALGRRRLRPRVHVAAVRGYDKALERVGDALTSRLGLCPTDEPLLDEAVLARGGRPAGTPSKVDVRLERGARGDVAAAAVLEALLAVTKANMDGAIADLDPEFLHDLRVSVRKTRAVQRELRQVFEPDALGGFRAEYGWLQQVTGDARDLDVYLLEFEPMRALLPESIRPDLDALKTVLTSRRTSARRRMTRALRSERTAALLSQWGAFLDRLPTDGGAQGPDAGRPIEALAGERIAKVYKRMVRMGEAIGSDSEPAEYHELRKQGKELRYLLELFGAPLFEADVVKPMIRALKALQDVLGRHQDREVQAVTLRSLSSSVAAISEGPAALMAMGVLVERLDEDERAARDQFAATFAEFAAKQRGKLVRETFA